MEIVLKYYKRVPRTQWKSYTSYVKLDQSCDNSIMWRIKVLEAELCLMRAKKERLVKMGLLLNEIKKKVMRPGH